MYKYFCDRCGKEITDVYSDGVMMGNIDIIGSPEKNKHFSLCPACVDEVGDVIRDIIGGGNEQSV